MAGRVDVGGIRRAQIVEAANRVIARKGIQGASLAEIEKEANISRGVLTYHFPAKEDIILAVFDAAIARLEQEGPPGFVEGDAPPGEGFHRKMEFLLTKKPPNDENDCLHYTFLAQMSHRDDFRARLAAEYAKMRERVAVDIAELPGAGDLDPGDMQAVAAITHGVLAGLVMQLNADPQALDAPRVAGVFRAMLEAYLARPGAEQSADGPPAGPGKKHARKK